MRPAYYNEHDPRAAAWLRELIKAGHIAPGGQLLQFLHQPDSYDEKH